MSAEQGQEALAQAKRLMPAALGSTSTKETRLAFYKQLIKLASYPNYQSRSYFGTLLAKFFAEFEDLQDEAVDALLDLCEDDDEKTRIVGIQGLGSTGKADPRWVKGNTGVLLQLLGSQPRELRHVKDSLSTLIKASADDVYEVMADNINSAESETGVSRAKIEEFIRDNAPQAKDFVYGQASKIKLSRMDEEKKVEKPGTERADLKEERRLPTGPAAGETKNRPLESSTPLDPHTFSRSNPTPSSSKSSSFAPPNNAPSGPRAEVNLPVSASVRQPPIGPRSIPGTSSASRSQQKAPTTPSNQSTSSTSTVQHNVASAMPIHVSFPPQSSAPVQDIASSRPSTLDFKVDISTFSPQPISPSQPQEVVTPKAAPSSDGARAAPQTSGPPSLASRLSYPSSTVKRSREEPASARPPESNSRPPSLLSRLSASSSTPTPQPNDLLSRLSSTDSRDPKRPRASLDANTPSRSLLDRLKSPSSTPSSPLPPAPPANTPISGPFSIVNRSNPAVHTPISTPLSIRSRSQTPIAPPIPTPAERPTSINIRTSTQTTPPEEDGIIRKGRGFKRDADDDILMLPPVQGIAHAYTLPGGGGVNSGTGLKRHTAKGGFGGFGLGNGTSVRR